MDRVLSSQNDSCGTSKTIPCINWAVHELDIIYSIELDDSVMLPVSRKILLLLPTDRAMGRTSIRFSKAANGYAHVITTGLNKWRRPGALAARCFIQGVEIYAFQL